MDYVTPEELRAAKALDLLSYLRQYEPEELVRLGNGTFCTRTHDSLKISNGKWHWFSQGVGGRSALDYLIKVRGFSLQEAVRQINGKAAVRPPVFYVPEAVRERHLQLPEVCDHAAEVTMYLLRRGMD